MKHAEFAKKVGVTPPFVSQVATRRTKLPMDRVAEWAAALGLKGQERSIFTMYAGLAHVPDPTVRDAIADELERLWNKVAELDARARRLQ